MDVHRAEPCYHRESEEGEGDNHERSPAKLGKFRGKTRYVDEYMLPHRRDEDAEETGGYDHSADPEHRLPDDPVVLLCAEEGYRCLLSGIAERPEYGDYGNNLAPAGKGFGGQKTPGDTCSDYRAVCLGDK